jgi:hypothetical protein
VRHDRYLASAGAKQAQLRPTANASNGGYISYDAEQASADYGMPSLPGRASAPPLPMSPQQSRTQFSAPVAYRQFSEIEAEQRRIPEEVERGPAYRSSWGTQSVPATPNRGGGAQHLQRASVSQHSTRLRPSTKGSTRRCALYLCSLPEHFTRVAWRAKSPGLSLQQSGCRGREVLT